MTNSGIDGVGEVAWGTHFCQFYETAQDLTGILVPYFAAGLRQNECCIWVTSELLPAEEAKAALGAAIGDLEPYFSSGQLEICDHRAWYTSSGRFQADRALQGWITKLEGARERGFDGLRKARDTSWLQPSEWQDFMEYEARVDHTMGQYWMLALCPYSLRKCGPPEILDVMANHDFALVRRDGAWQTIESAERKRAKEALRESEERWRTTLTSIGDAVIATDRAGAVVFMNRVGEQLTGWTSEEALREPITEVFRIVNRDTRREVESPVTRALREGTVVGLANHTLLIRKDGAELPIDDSGAPIRNRRGEALGAVLVFRDITERIRAEETIRRKEARLESLLRVAQYPVCPTKELLDYALSEAIALTDSKIGYIYHYDDTTRVFTLNSWSGDVMTECLIRDPQTVYQLDQTGLWGEAVRQGQPIVVNDFEAPHPLKRGYPEGHAPLRKYLTIPVSVDNRIVGVVGVANKEADYDADDVRQLVLLMDAVWRIAELREAERHTAWLASFPEQNLAPITEVEASGKVFYASPAAQRALPGLAEEGLRHPWLAGLGEVKAALADGSPYRVRDVQVGDTWYQQTIVATVEDRLRIYGADITERKLAEEARTRLAQTLTAEISHRTKNNLAIVAGLLQLQLERDPDPNSHIDMIRDAITRIMSIAALHEQMYQRHSDAIELCDALRRIAEVDRQALSAADATISVKGQPTEYPSRVASNLCVVANELVTNAIKHGGPPGTAPQIEIRLDREGGRLALSVWNAHNPVAADFDVGRRARTGLALVRSLVEEQYGGSFTLRPDRGGTRAQIILEEDRLLRQ